MVFSKEKSLKFGGPSLNGFERVARNRSLSQQVISHSAPEMPFTALHTGFFPLSQQSLVEQDLA